MKYLPCTSLEISVWMYTYNEKHQYLECREHPLGVTRGLCTEDWWNLSLMDHSNQVKFCKRGLLCPMCSFPIVTCTFCLLQTSSTNMACLLSRCCWTPITVGWQSLIPFLRLLSLQIELRNKLICHDIVASMAAYTVDIAPGRLMKVLAEATCCKL